MIDFGWFLRVWHGNTAGRRWNDDNIAMIGNGPSLAWIMLLKTRRAYCCPICTNDINAIRLVIKLHRLVLNNGRSANDIILFVHIHHIGKLNELLVVIRSELHRRIIARR